MNSNINIQNINICFILPKPKPHPVGGYKVVYDYSNFLVKNGINVSICYLSYSFGSRFKFFPNLLKIIYGYYMIFRYRWYALDKHVKEYIVIDQNDILKINSDLYICTAIQTFSVLKKLNVSLKNKAYLIQGLENWNNISLEYVYDSYKFNIKKIVVSKWLYELVKKYDTSNNVYLCVNGIDVAKFKLLNNIDNRDAKAISFMYDTNYIKGPDIIESVVSRLIKKYPDLIVNAFGKFNKPSFLRDKDNYICAANIEQIIDIYNNSSIFISSSREEGFGLTGIESMACGCALVTTKTNGSQEYANDNNSILCDVDNPDLLFSAVSRLIDNPLERINLAKNGFKDSQKYNIFESDAKFLSIIKDFCKE